LRRGPFRKRMVKTKEMGFGSLRRARDGRTARSGPTFCGRGGEGGPLNGSKALGPRAEFSRPGRFSAFMIQWEPRPLVRSRSVPMGTPPMKQLYAQFQWIALHSRRGPASALKHIRVPRSPAPARSKCKASTKKLSQTSAHAAPGAMTQRQKPTKQMAYAGSAKGSRFGGGSHTVGPQQFSQSVTSIN
jgi:hypothetical protein